MYLSVTAAHCTWKVKEGTLRVALGKFYRDFEKNQELTQVKEVCTIHFLHIFSEKAYFHAISNV
jgi:hypothetical protein